jgi:hypothetical protein
VIIPQCPQSAAISTQLPTIYPQAPRQLSIIVEQVTGLECYSACLSFRGCRLPAGRRDTGSCPPTLISVMALTPWVPLLKQKNKKGKRKQMNG